MVFTPVQGNPTSSVTYGTDNTKIASGSTTPGATNWQVYNPGGIYVEVDTSAAGFTSTPVYVTSIGGKSGHWKITGGGSVYQATATSFRVYIRWDKVSETEEALTPEMANGNEWHLNWIAIEQGTSAQTSTLPTPGKDYYIVAKHSGKVLAVASGKKENATTIAQYDKSVSDNYKFQLRDAGEGYFYIVAKHSGKGVAVTGAKKENGAAIVQWEVVNSDNHKFQLQDAGDGSFYIVAKHSGKVLAVASGKKENGTTVAQYDKSVSDNYKWKFEAV